MDRTAERQAALLRAERQLSRAFDAIVDAGDALFEAGLFVPGLRVHEEAAHVATWRQYVERERKGEADGNR